MSPPRTLPIRLARLPGEALDSWLETIAHRLTVPLNDLMWAIGLPGGARRRSNRPGGTDRTIALAPAQGSRALQREAEVRVRGRPLREPRTLPGGFPQRASSHGQ
jgi:hypothetical protein